MLWPLFLPSLSVIVAIVNAQIEEDNIGLSLSLCCEIGQGRSEVMSSDDDCGNFPVPVANVSVQHQAICIATIEICCTAARREQDCLSGRQAAQNGQDCLPESGEAHKTCCLACKLGLMTSALNPMECVGLSDKVPSPWKQSFGSCCQNYNSSTTTAIQEEEEEEDNRCPFGFQYNALLNVCDDIDECLTEGANTCDREYETCVNTVGDYICQPHDDNHGDLSTGSDQSCPPGHSFFLISCIDIDECADGTHNCRVGEVCHNQVGSFRCDSLTGGGPVEDKECPRGFQPDARTGDCADVNECASGTHNCMDSQRCDNTLGSFTCVRFITCGTGYTFSQNTGQCEDDDECALGLHNCQGLGKAYDCRNTRGSFRCERRTCPEGQLLNEDTGQCAQVICQEGFTIGPAGTCVDVDECADSQLNPCSDRERCENTMGAFNCIEQCSVGMQLTSDGSRCVDVDECTRGTHNCYGGRTCINTMGSFKCACPQGYELSPSTAMCRDIDECANPYTVCGLDSECQNSPGSFRCVCKPGFRRSRDDDRTSRCVDINECQTIPGICQQRCANMWGSYRCHCQPGYRLSTDGRSCVDIDECTEYGDICIGNCLNEPGSYRCTCPHGYTLSSNKRSCEDIDECAPEQGESPCRGGDRQHCFNTRGGYKCIDTSCPDQYVQDETINSKRCKLKPEARACPDATDIDCLRRPVSLSYNFLSLVSELKVVTSNSVMGIDLFTMQSAQYYTLTTRFTLTVKSVRAAKDVDEKADRNFFRLKTPAPHRAIVSLVKPIQGPQDIVLELLMEMYHLGRYQASALANIHIFVTPYRF